MWVEVKHGADVHGMQLEDYLADIEAAAASGGDWPVVLLIAPRRAMPKGETPPEVGVVEWEQLARFAAVRAAGIAPTLPQRWILDQYTTYLEEEALLNPPALTAGHAFALSEEGPAHEAMRTICSEANAYVEQHWAPRSNRAKDFGPGYYAHHPKRDSARSSSSRSWAPRCRSSA